MNLGAIFRLSDAKIIIAFIILVILTTFFLVILMGRIDYIFNIFHSQAESKDKIFISDSVNQEFYHAPNSSVLWVRVPYWGEKVYLTKSLKNKMKDHGFSFLDYEFSTKVLSSDKNLTKESFQKINQLVASDVKRLKKQYNFSEINIMGASLGTSNLFSIANDNSELFTKIVAVVPGNSLAEGMWEGISTQKVRKRYEAKNITLDQLNEEWKELAPGNNLKNLKGKKIYVYISRADKVIPYKHGLKLLEEMKKVGIVPIVKENRYLGHYGTVINSYFFPTYL